MTTDDYVIAIVAITGVTLVALAGIPKARRWALNFFGVTASAGSPARITASNVKTGRDFSVVGPGDVEVKDIEVNRDFSITNRDDGPHP